VKQKGYLQTGQISCHDVCGHEILCTGSGQDAEYSTGVVWPRPRFLPEGGLVIDQLTGLVWTRDANIAEFPLTWRESLDFVAHLNGERIHGHSDWRLPNRCELRSLLSHQTKRPALPQDHPFANVFPGWYWTSTTAVISPSHAWYVNMDGRRMFYGGKDQSFMVWPVRGDSRVLPVSGQTLCYDVNGQVIDCSGGGQDGEHRIGAPWPVPRFETHEGIVVDRLTNLCWCHSSDHTGAIGWAGALAAVARLNKDSDARCWRLPNINELESLVDAGSHKPALPAGHPFVDVRDVYWSSTTSLYEPDWAWALYLDKGAVGVGQKVQARFSVWAVKDVA